MKRSFIGEDNVIQVGEGVEQSHTIEEYRKTLRQRTRLVLQLKLQRLRYALTPLPPFYSVEVRCL